MTEPVIPEAILALLIDGAIAGILLLFYFLRKRAKEIAKKILEKKPEKKPEKPAPAAPVKRGIRGYLKTVIALVIIIAIIALVWTIALPALQQGKISIPSLPQGELYGHLSSNSVQKPDGSWVATINPKTTFSEASKVPVKGKVKTTFEATGAVKTTTRKDDLAYHEDPYGPEGNPDTPRCTNCIVPGSPWMGLVGKYVSSDGKNVSYLNFKADRKVTVTFPKDGNVYFTVNEVSLPNIPWAMEDNTGGFTVTVKTAK